MAGFLHFLVKLQPYPTSTTAKAGNSGQPPKYNRRAKLKNIILAVLLTGLLAAGLWFSSPTKTQAEVGIGYGYGYGVGR